MRVLRASVTALLAVVAVAIGANLLGAILPARVAPLAANAAPPRTVFLLRNPLHTDILIPSDADVLARLPFLRSSPVPVDHPDLEWLSIGWGSHDFYTTAGEYSDISLRAVWRAATGDRSVMRIVGVGPLDVLGDQFPLRLSGAQFAALLDAVAGTFDRSAGGDVRPIPEASLAPGDAFFHARGHFHLFDPCNEWTRRMLNAAGVATGRWTPTSAGLALSLRLHGGR